MMRCPGVKISVHTEPVQNFPKTFFDQFQVIIAGLDNVDARRWINSMVHDLVQWDGSEANVNTCFIDGGTEGFSGQTAVIIPYTDACYDCKLDTLPPATTFPMCTIKATPRLPEHCIMYAY